MPGAISGGVSAKSCSKAIRFRGDVTEYLPGSVSSKD